MDAFVIRSASKAVNASPTNAKAAPIVQGSFTARWNEKRQHFGILSGGTFITPATAEAKARRHLSELAVTAPF